MPRPKPEARPAGTSDARSYLDKTQEFLRAAQHSLEPSNHTAAVGNAVHAGIAAGDEGRQAGRQLRRLLPMKTRAEYDPAPMKAADARTAVQAAERMVALAVQALASMPGDDR